jgi:cbb3-type cytochrome oxidase subunit 1
LTKDSKFLIVLADTSTVEWAEQSGLATAWQVRHHAVCFLMNVNQLKMVYSWRKPLRYFTPAESRVCLQFLHFWDLLSVWACAEHKSCLEG